LFGIDRSVIYRASRVGVMTSARVAPLGKVNSRCRICKRNAVVFPVDARRQASAPAE
jgi:hypothetical protein